MHPEGAPNSVRFWWIAMAHFAGESSLPCNAQNGMYILHVENHGPASAVQAVNFILILMPCNKRPAGNDVVRSWPKKR
jgi:hypothetical protein